MTAIVTLPAANGMRARSRRPSGCAGRWKRTSSGDAASTPPTSSCRTGSSLADAFTTLSPAEKRFVSQIQGRTYANIFGLVERFINAKVLELSHDHWFGDQLRSRRWCGSATRN